MYATGQYIVACIRVANTEIFQVCADDELL